MHAMCSDMLMKRQNKEDDMKAFADRERPDESPSAIRVFPTESEILDWCVYLYSLGHNIR